MIKFTVKKLFIVHKIVAAVEDLDEKMTNLSLEGKLLRNF